MNFIAVDEAKTKCVVGCGSPAVCADGYCQKCKEENEALDLAFARKLARKAYRESAEMALDDVENERRDDPRADPLDGWPHVPTTVLLTTVILLVVWIVYEICGMFVHAVLDGWRPWV